MIESDIVTKEQDIKYPKLMVSGDLIVLFRKSGEGVVIRPGGENSIWSEAEYIKSWCMTGFTDFKGDLILRNK